MQTIISVLVFVTVFVLTLSVWALRQDRARARKRKLIRSIVSDGGGMGTVAGAGEGAGGQATRLVGRLAEWIDMTPLELLIQSSGASITVERFLVASAALGGAALMLPLLFFPHPVLVAAAPAAGACIPWGVLRITRKRTENALVQQLPEAIDTVVRSLRAGQSVDSAMQEISSGLPAPVGTQFTIIREEIAMGLPFETALRNFQRRFPRVVDINLLCVAFIIQRETGGNLAEILASLAATIRDRFRVKRQVRVSSSEARASAIILGALPAAFALITWAMKPDYIDVFLTHPVGKKLFFAVIALELAGFLAMRRLSKVEV
ncbi:MAG: type II secretion system F family protein [Syntrophobacteraceae bacterium]